MGKLTELDKVEEISFSSTKLDSLHFTPGIWLNGNCHWLHDVREKVMYSEKMTVKVVLERIHSKIWYYRLFVSNHSTEPKDMKVLAAHYHPNLLEKQFSFASPTDRNVYHLINEDVYMVNARCNGKPANEYTIQPFWNLISNQIWNCEHLGSLKYQPMVKGPATSILALDTTIGARETVQIQSWVIHGKSRQEVGLLNHVLLNKQLKR
ncbi:hypothetical protein ACQYAD_16585 [Neobacillus sp. SM06]|uniref:hypothetical protein n=1 Tax=Neobacillus sp. SM06 TaxID=3422492 RepID=UPI003D26DAA6